MLNERWSGDMIQIYDHLFGYYDKFIIYIKTLNTMVGGKWVAY